MTTTAKNDIKILQLCKSFNSNSTFSFSFFFSSNFSKNHSPKWNEIEIKLTSIDSKNHNQYIYILEWRIQIKNSFRRIDRWRDKNRTIQIFNSSRMKNRFDGSDGRCIRKRDQLRAIFRAYVALIIRETSSFRPVIYRVLHLHNNNSRARKCNRNECRRNITRLFPSPPPSAIINRRD